MSHQTPKKKVCVICKTKFSTAIVKSGSTCANCRKHPKRSGRGFLGCFFHSPSIDRSLLQSPARQKILDSTATLRQPFIDDDSEIKERSIVEETQESYVTDLDEKLDSSSSLSELAIQIRNLQQEIEEFKLTRVTEEAIVLLKVDVDDLKSLVVLKDETLSLSRAEVEDLKSQIILKDKALTSLNESVEEVKSQVALKDKALDSLGGSVDALQSQAVLRDQALTLLRGEVDGLQSQAVIKDEVLSSLSRTINDLQLRIVIKRQSIDFINRKC